MSQKARLLNICLECQS